MRRTLAIGMMLLAGLVGTTPVHAAFDSCSETGLRKFLGWYMDRGEAVNLMHKSWWTRCPLHVRKAVWATVTIVPPDDGRAAWQTGTSDPLPVLAFYPEFKNLEFWQNSQPLTLSNLYGDIVVVHFWSSSCVRCMHTLPKMQELEDTFGTHRFRVIGIHAPRLAYEKSPQIVRDVIDEYGITFPVALDNGLETWGAFANQYRPATYVLDGQGRVRFTHFGEGGYDETERAIRTLLNER